MGDEVEILSAKEYDTWNSGVSFSLSNRIYRAAWMLTWMLLASWTPPNWHPWRRILLTMFGAQVSRNSGVYGSARIWSPMNLVVGEGAYIGPNTIVYSMARIELKPFSLISQGAHICAGTHDIDDPHFQLVAKSIVIGSRAWIAADAFVGPGVVVGEGAVLGARGCAFRDLEPWTVYGGNPARPIRKRIVRFPHAPR